MYNGDVLGLLFIGLLSLVMILFFVCGGIHRYGREENSGFRVEAESKVVDHSVAVFGSDPAEGMVAVLV